MVTVLDLNLPQSPISVLDPLASWPQANPEQSLVLFIYGHVSQSLIHAWSSYGKNQHTKDPLFHPQHTH